MPDALNPAEVDGAPNVFIALKKLGLALDSRKGPMDVLVIDSAGRPSEN